MMWGTGSGSWILGFLMMMLFFGGLVALAVYLLRGWDSNERSNVGHPNSPDARAILEERFAKGELSKDEFEQRRRVLEHATR